VDTLPVASNSDAIIATIGAGTGLHPDFGSGKYGGGPIGIPFNVVTSATKGSSPKFLYADESDPGPYPFGTDTPIEGGSDRHALMVDRDTCTLYELYAAHYASGGSTAGSGAIWNLRSNALRPAGWTSADAAGLPIFAGLVRLDEIQKGVVDHAIRVTASQTDRSYVWPARHQAGAANNHNLPPMGARFRLKQSYSTSGFRSDTKVILAAMKRYGMIVADNGSDWYFTGTAENGWSEAMLDELKTVPASAFEAVDASSLMVSASSGRVRSQAPAATPVPSSPRPRPRSSSRATPTPTPTQTPTVSPTPTAPTATPSPAPATALGRGATGDGRSWWPVLLPLAALGAGVWFALRRRARRI